MKAYPFAAGLDPRFRELDDAQGSVLRSEAFRQALDEFCADGDPDRLRLLATYGGDGLRRMLTGVYETLRSAGRELSLEIGERTDLPQAVDELREAARCLVEDAAATDNQRSAATQVLALLERDTRPDRLMELSGFRASGERAASYEEARKATEHAALDEAASRDRALLQELLERFAASYSDAKARESALDFEDLQLLARNLLRDNPEIREREGLRFRSIMVDEFQDTNRLQCDLVDLLRWPEAEVFFVGDEFQSIYGFRHADVGVFRERRAQSAQLLPLTLNYRSRAEVLAVVNELFGCGLRRRVPAARRGGRVPRPGVRPAGRAARDRQVELRRHRRALAPRRGARGRAARRRARRRGRRDGRARSCCSSRPAPTRSGTRRSCAAQG